MGNFLTGAIRRDNLANTHIRTSKAKTDIIMCLDNYLLNTVALRGANIEK